MRVQQPTINNCLLAAVYLWVRGSVSALVLVSSRTIFFPCHFVCMTKSGHIIHYVTDGRYTAGCTPCWFSGRWIGVRKGQLGFVLAVSGRRVLRIEKNQFSIGLILISLVVILLIPWCIGWWSSLFLRPIWPLVNGWIGIKARK